jgi:hypothetical protein
VLIDLNFVMPEAHSDHAFPDGELVQMEMLQKHCFVETLLLALQRQEVSCIHVDWSQSCACVLIPTTVCFTKANVALYAKYLKAFLIPSCQVIERPDSSMLDLLVLHMADYCPKTLCAIDDPNNVVGYAHLQNGRLKKDLEVQIVQENVLLGHQILK